VILAGPFELDDAARHEGAQHIELLLQTNRQRMASCVEADSRHRPIVLGIVGAGVMGTAIAADALAHGVQVRIMDADDAALERAAETVAALTEDDDDAAASERFKTTGDLDEIAACGIVLEAVVEDEMKKGALLRDLDRRMPPESLLATNTSTIPIGRLARAVQNPERLCGTHFFLPLPERPVVEVIFTDHTSPEARATAIGLTMTIGRSALFAPDAVGFVVNRLMMPYVSEGMQLLTEGVEPEVIEQVAVRFGMPKGPLSLLDEVGLDTALDCGWVFAGAYEERFAVSPLPVTMVKAGRLGQKTGAGFFRYTTSGDGTIEQELDPAAMEVIARWAGPPSGVTEEEIAARLFLPMLFEGSRMLEEHEACVAADVDLGAVLGLGMAPWRGGPLYWCDRVGARRVLEIAKPLESLGARMEPPEPLRRMAETEMNFHDQTSRA
jgi:3-hydroxyacyl-CoA dehydrogenase / enoyl-CoA hydratase / 3-hydroxybutyryl-CoA epimerase / enoyl-CoA isomerase